MKQTLLRASCAALSLSLAAGLFTSCSILPTPTTPVTHPEQEEPKNYDASSLQDGKLRILYSYNSPGGNTILCGDTVLHQASNSETTTLLTDTFTGETNYYFSRFSDSQSATGRRCALYDTTGTEVLSFPQEYDATLSGGLLILTTPTDFAYSPMHNHAEGDVRVVDLSTGKDLPVPENAYTCIAAGDRLAFGIYAPGDATPDEETDDLFPYSMVQIQEKDGTVVYQNLHGVLYAISTAIDDPLTPTDWVEIDTYSEDGMTLEGTSLLNVLTGEERPGFALYLHSGIASFQTDSGSYQLVSLVSDTASTVLCEFDHSISAYAPGVAVTYRQDLGDYELHDLNTGEVLAVRDEALGSDTLAVYAKDGTLRVYDSNTGAILTDTVVEPIENLQRTDLYDEGRGWVWLRQYDNDDYEVTTSTVCGPNGTNKNFDLDALKAHYGDAYHGYLWPVAATEDTLYFALSYNGPGSTWLYDVLDSDGNLVLEGLGACNSYYINSSNPLPDGVFVARKGFEYGWMDIHGNWVYCHSIFDSTSDDTDNYYF